MRSLSRILVVALLVALLSVAWQLARGELGLDHVSVPEAWAIVSVTLALIALRVGLGRGSVRR